MKYLKLIILVSLVGCKSIDVSEANKMLVKKGNPQGSDYLDYSVVLRSEAEFSINNISIEGNSLKLNYYYKDLKTGLSSYKMLSPFPKGNYSFNFRINDISNFKTKENLIIDIEMNSKKVLKKIPILENKKTILTR
jgi:hypothetical protein